MTTAYLPRLGFLAYRIPIETDDFKERLRRNEDMLSRCLNMRTAVAVIGAGCSKPLGYPLWEEFVEQVLEEACTIVDSDKRKEIETLAKGVDKFKSEEMMFALGRCQKILESETKENREVRSFHELVASLFKSPGKERTRINPYDVLLKLPIHRFVTTNYDTELEDALAKSRQIEPSRFGVNNGNPGSDPLSITQEDIYLQQLTRFSLAGLSSNEDMVFHCHGRWDRPDSIVATEHDYQQRYLALRKQKGRAFRDSIDLLFSSNPLLFVGYGLGDEDLLRPLRVLGARDPDLKHTRPIFVLMKLDLTNDRAVMKAEMLYERYGVHVVPYEVVETRSDRGLCFGIEKIFERWQTARDEWARKPPPRSPKPFPSKKRRTPRSPKLFPSKKRRTHTSTHTNIDLLNPVEVPARKMQELPNQVANSSSRVIGLIGPTGCGKTWHATQLVNHFENAKKTVFPDGIFYWNAHYSNEALTSLDRLDRFLRGPKGDFSKPVFERLTGSLRGRACLVVIDGCERFLRPTEQPFVGTAYDQSFVRLFELFREPENMATVLLVGRLWPEIYVDEASAASPGLIHVPLEPVRLTEANEFWIKNMGQPSPEPDLGFSALCAMLEGHNFALRLSFALIGNAEQAGNRAQEIRRLLAGARPDRRVATILREVLADLNRESGGLAEPMLALLATSLNAVCDRTFELCRQEAMKHCGIGPQKGRALKSEEICDLLKERRLLIEMPRILADGKEEAVTYMVHASIRSLFYKNRRGLPADNLPTFPLAGLASGGLDVDPRQGEGLQRILRFFSKVLDEAKSALAQNDRQVAIDLCRDAYSVLRARMSATTVPRWGKFSDYSALGLRLIYLAKWMGADQSANWGPRDAEDLSGLEREDGALYLAELAWLYNDIAVALASEGMIYDAVPTFMLANEVGRMIEPTDTGGPYRIQVLLNLSKSMFERGQLRAAERYLLQASHMNASLGDPDYAARIVGYDAMLNHLRGNVKNADDGYENCIKKLRKLPNIRARSFFYRCWADLLIYLSGIEKKRLDEADLHIRSARILAGEGHFPDLEIEAQISEGVLLEAREEWYEARLRLNAALSRARHIGSQRLEAEAFCRLARLARSQGDLDGARRNATQALRIANSCGLGLRRTHSLLILGLATVDAGQRELGKAYLRQAGELADRQQYWIRAREAEEALQRLAADRG